ncbi:MAG TPA: hypothetical protein VMT18_00585 [Planctomycetota bacterium]|nr:hypothetical protein [Planctomycetota bacterium]
MTSERPPAPHPLPFAFGPRALYVWCPKGVIDSAPMTALQKRLGEDWTARNRATVEKLAALAAG